MCSEPVVLPFLIELWLGVGLWGFIPVEDLIKSATVESAFVSLWCKVSTDVIGWGVVRCDDSIFPPEIYLSLNAESFNCSYFKLLV